MSGDCRELLAELGSQVVEELIRRRGWVRGVYEGVEDDDLSELFTAMVARVTTFVRNHDADAFQGYVKRWATMRLGGGAALDSLIPGMLAVGDGLIEAVERHPDGSSELVAHLARANRLAARCLVEMLASELAHRRARSEVSEMEP